MNLNTLKFLISAAALAALCQGCEASKHDDGMNMGDATMGDATSAGDSSSSGDTMSGDAGQTDSGGASGGMDM